MSSGSFWAFREAAELPDYDPQEPDFTSLWDKVHVARKAHLCTACGEEIAVGTRYRSIGFIMDGRFETMKEHGNGGYPSSCPKWAERDRADLADQFERDRAEFFPAESGAGVCQGSEADTAQGNLPPEAIKNLTQGEGTP